MPSQLGSYSAEIPVYLTLLLAACGLILLFNTWSGYRGGALAQLFTLGTLLISGALFAALVASRPTLAVLGFVPALVQPYLLAGAAALLLNAVLSFLWRRTLNRMDAFAYLQRQAEIKALAEAGTPPEELPRAGSLRPVTDSPANRTWGLLFGAVKGAVWCGVLLVIVYTAGTMAQATQSVMAPRPGKHEEPGPVRDMLLDLGQQMQRTPVGAIADRVAPVKAKQAAIIGKLGRLTKNEAAAKRFGSHPEIQALGKNPSIAKLMKDPRIAKEVEQQRWNDLMNEPAVSKLANDPALRKQIQEIDFEKILNEALKPKQETRPAE